MGSFNEASQGDDVCIGGATVLLVVATFVLRYDLAWPDAAAASLGHSIGRGQRQERGKKDPGSACAGTSARESESPGKCTEGFGG